MEELNSQYWNNRYQNNDFGWDSGSITTPLKEYIDQLKNKELNILIPGAGNSYEAEYLFNHGFYHCFVLDYASVPLRNLQRRVPFFPDNHLIQEDFFNHHKHYDLIIEQTFFCALNPGLRKDYVKKMYELLNPKGKLIGLLFDDPMNSDKPPFGGSKIEYETLFGPYFNFKVFAPCYNSIKPRFGKELFMILEKK